MAYYHSRSYGPSILAFIGGAVAWALFGDKVKRRLNESKAWVELKREIRDEAEKVKDLTQEKYYQIVDEISDRYARLRGISKNELVDLVDDLKKHWRKIVNTWNE